MPDLVPFHSGQVKSDNLLVLGQVQNLYKVNKNCVFHIFTNYYEFTCCIENSVDMISWLLRSQLIWIYTVYKRVLVLYSFPKSKLFKHKTVYASLKSVLSDK